MLTARGSGRLNSGGRNGLTEEGCELSDKIMTCTVCVLTVLAVVRCSSFGVTDVMVVHRPLLYEIQYSGSLAAS